MTKDYPVGEKDLTGLLSDVKRKKPQAVIALSYPADSFLLTRQLQGVQFNPSFLFELVGPSIAAFGQVFGGAAEDRLTVLSDVDILIVIDKKLSLVEKAKLKADIIWNAEKYGFPLHYPIDIHVVSQDELKEYLKYIKKNISFLQ